MTLGKARALPAPVADVPPVPPARGVSPLVSSLVALEGTKSYVVVVFTSVAFLTNECKRFS